MARHAKGLEVFRVEGVAAPRQRPLMITFEPGGHAARRAAVAVADERGAARPLPTPVAEGLVASTHELRHEEPVLGSAGAFAATAALGNRQNCGRRCIVLRPEPAAALS